MNFSPQNCVYSITINYKTNQRHFLFFTLIVFFLQKNHNHSFKNNVSPNFLFMEARLISIASLVVLFLLNTVSFAQGENEQLARFNSAAIHQSMVSRSSVASQLEHTLATDGIESVMDMFDLMRSEPLQYQTNEREMTELGMALMLAGKTDESITILHLTTQTYSNSWQAYENLGNAYLAQGKLLQAEQCFDKAADLKGINDLQQDNTYPQIIGFIN